MTHSLMTRYYQLIEHARQAGLLSAIKLSFYKSEEILPVEKDLHHLKEVKCNFDESQYRIVEIDHTQIATFPYIYYL